MNRLPIILLYGQVADDAHPKQQKMIDGSCTCGYREFAENAGKIIYLRPQSNLIQDWEVCLNAKQVENLLNNNPDAIVWSVKKCDKKDKILRNCDNFSFYYSCVNRKHYNSSADISLVDTTDRIKNDKCILHLKGKDPNYWLPSKEKKYDYVLMGDKKQKNQRFVINQMTENVKNKRSILWIGGNKSGINKSHHDITIFGKAGPNKIKELLPQAKIGILYTEYLGEGFPQTFLEMTMCGVPVVYPSRAPMNEFYKSDKNCLFVKKKNNIWRKSEDCLFEYTSKMAKECRDFAASNYSISCAIDRMHKMREKYGK